MWLQTGALTIEQRMPEDAKVAMEVEGIKAAPLAE
jgi:hypothetical protein